MSLEQKDKQKLSIVEMILIIVTSCAIIAIIGIIYSLIVKNEKSANWYASICYYILIIDAIGYSIYLLFTKK